MQANTTLVAVAGAGVDCLRVDLDLLGPLVSSYGDIVSHAPKRICGAAELIRLR